MSDHTITNHRSEGSLWADERKYLTDEYRRRHGKRIKREVRRAERRYGTHIVRQLIIEHENE